MTMTATYTQGPAPAFVHYPHQVFGGHALKYFEVLEYRVHRHLFLSLDHFQYSSYMFGFIGLNRILVSDRVVQNSFMGESRENDHSYGKAGENE